MVPYTRPVAEKEMRGNIFKIESTTLLMDGRWKETKNDVIYYSHIVFFPKEF